MKLVLTFLACMISPVLFAQNNVDSKPKSNAAAVAPANATEKTSDKKVHYVNKRTKSVQNNSTNNSYSQANKKSLIRKSENQQKVVPK